MRILLVLVLILLIVFCAMIVLWVPLPGAFPPPFSKGRNLLAAVLTGILGIAYLAGLTIYLVSPVLRPTRALDPVLDSLGLTPQGYVLAGRRYEGSFRGRHTEVRYTPSQGNRSALIDVYVAGDLGTRIAIGTRRPLLDCAACPRLETADELWVLTKDEARATTLLADSEVRALLTRLVSGFAELYVQPDRIWFRARPWQVTEDLLREWLDGILALAEAAERAPAR